MFHQEGDLASRTLQHCGGLCDDLLRLLLGLGGLLRGGGEGGGREQGVPGGEELVLGDGEAGDGLRPPPQG